MSWQRRGARSERQEFTSKELPWLSKHFLSAQKPVATAQARVATPPHVGSHTLHKGFCWPCEVQKNGFSGKHLLSVLHSPYDSGVGEAVGTQDWPSPERTLPCGHAQADGLGEITRVAASQ